MAKKQDIEKTIQQVLSDIRPAIQMDGGDVEFVRFDPENRIVTVRMYGACQGCPMSLVTLKQGICQMIQDRIPEIADVVTEDEV